MPTWVVLVSPAEPQPGPINTVGAGLSAEDPATGNQCARITVPSNEVMSQSRELPRSFALTGVVVVGGTHVDTGVVDVVEVATVLGAAVDGGAVLVGAEVVGAAVVAVLDPALLHAPAINANAASAGSARTMVERAWVEAVITPAT